MLEWRDMCPPMSACADFHTGTLNCAPSLYRRSLAASSLSPSDSALCAWVKRGDTPLMKAAYCGHVAAVKVLLVCGASIHAKERDVSVLLYVQGRTVCLSVEQALTFFTP
jgi:hypothetical protein